MRATFADDTAILFPHTKITNAQSATVSHNQQQNVCNKKSSLTASHRIVPTSLFAAICSTNHPEHNLNQRPLPKNLSRS